MNGLDKNTAKVLDKYSKKFTKEDVEDLKGVFSKTIQALKQELVDDEVDWSNVPYPKTSNGAGFFEEVCDITISQRMDTEEILKLDEDLLDYFTTFRD